MAQRLPFHAEVPILELSLDLFSRKFGCYLWGCLWLLRYRMSLVRTMNVYGKKTRVTHEIVIHLLLTYNKILLLIRD